MEAQAQAQDGAKAPPIHQLTPEELAAFYQNFSAPTPRPAFLLSMFTPVHTESQRMRVI